MKTVPSVLGKLQNVLLCSVFAVAGLGVFALPQSAEAATGETGIRSSYTIRATDGVQRLFGAELEAARVQLESTLGIPVTMGDTYVMRSERKEGEIIVRSGGSFSLCAHADVAGCAKPLVNEVERAIAGGEIWLDRDIAGTSSAPAVTLHEFGHVFGLAHSDAGTESGGDAEIMNQIVPEIDAYGPGDRAALARIASRIVEPVDPVGSFTVAANQDGSGVDVSVTSFDGSVPDAPASLVVTIDGVGDFISSQAHHTELSMRVSSTHPNICVQIRDIGFGNDTDLGCRSVEVIPTNGTQADGEGTMHPRDLWIKRVKHSGAGTGNVNIVVCGVLPEVMEGIDLTVTFLALGTGSNTDRVSSIAALDTGASWRINNNQRCVSLTLAEPVYWGRQGMVYRHAAVVTASSLGGSHQSVTDSAEMHPRLVLDDDGWGYTPGRKRGF